MQLEIDFEVWKPFLDGLYAVSSYGRLRSFDREVATQGFFKEKSIRIHKGKVLNDYCNGNGYRYITISIDSLRKNYYVHRIVAEMFVSNPYGYNEVNHKDGDKSNNMPYNLEWVTREENVHHAIRIGLWENQFGGNNTCAVRVINTLNYKVFGCIKDVAKYYDVPEDSIGDAVTTNPDRYHRVDLYNHLMRVDRFIEKYPDKSKSLGLTFQQKNNIN